MSVIATSAGGAPLGLPDVCVPLGLRKAHDATLRQMYHSLPQQISVADARAAVDESSWASRARALFQFACFGQPPQP